MIRPSIYIDKNFYYSTVIHWDNLDNDFLRFNDPLYKVIALGYSNLYFGISEDESQTLIERENDPYLKQLLFLNIYAEDSSNIFLGTFKNINKLDIKTIATKNRYSYFFSSINLEKVQRDRETLMINHYCIEDIKTLSNSESNLVFDKEIISGKIISYKDIIIQKSASTVIVDPYLLMYDDSKRLKNNLFKILSAVISNKLERTFTLIIFCSFYKNKFESIYDIINKNYKRIISFIKRHYPDLIFEIAIFHYKHHDRRLFTDQLYISSGNSFDYFKNSSDLNDRKKRDSIHIRSILSSKNTFELLLSHYGSLHSMASEYSRKRTLSIGNTSSLTVLKQ